jgi:small RNA 2'-O-methyltransferase
MSALFTPDRPWADPEMHGAGALHEARIEAVVDVLHRHAARSVADLGCGAGALLVRLAADPAFARLAGFDRSAAAVAAARRQQALAPALAAGRLSLDCASFLSPLPVDGVYDAAVLLEALEHVPPQQLSLLERAVFRMLRPRVVVVTTPNIEYNPLYGLPPGRLRHPDHHFEWAHARFRDWALGVAGRHGFEAALSGIGPVDAWLGAPTQMVVFVDPGKQHAPRVPL